MEGNMNRFRYFIMKLRSYKATWYIAGAIDVCILFALLAYLVR
jgi:hypothetical protein